MLLVLVWVNHRDQNCFLDLNLREVVIRVCPEQAVVVDTALLGDCEVAEYAMYIARGRQLLE